MAVISREDQDQLNALITVKIEENDYAAKVKKSLNKLSKEVQMKGFRKGMVPIGLVKKMYGNQVLAEELDKVLQDELYSYLTENKIDFLGRPLPSNKEQEELDINQQKDYTFEFQLGLSPEFEIGGIDKTEYPSYKIVVGDESVDDEVNQLRKRFGKLSQVEKVSEDDVLKVKLTEVDGAGNAIEEGVVNETSIQVNMITDKAAQKELKKLKLKGDMILDVMKAFDKEPEQIAKHILNIDELRLSTISTKFKLEIQEISHMEPAEIDQEFFDKVFGPDEVKSEDDMRQKIKTLLQESFGQTADTQLKKDLRKGVLDSTEMPLPDEFLKKFIEANNEKPLEPDSIEKGYLTFSNDLRWSLVRNKLAKENDLKVESEELESHAMNDVRQRMRYYGYGEMPEDQLKGIVANSLKEKEYRDQIFSFILDEKVFGVIQEKATLKDQDISLEDFNKLNKEQHEHA